MVCNQLASRSAYAGAYTVCVGTPGSKKTCKGDFPFLFKYKMDNSYRIFADKKYDADVEAKLKAIVFLWARNNGMFSIRNYHYPLAATLVMIAVLVFVQAILVFVIGKSVKKDSLIDRIRFDN